MASEMMKSAESIREQHMIAALEEIEKVVINKGFDDGKLCKIADIVEYWRNPTQYATGAYCVEKFPKEKLLTRIGKWFKKIFKPNRVPKSISSMEEYEKAAKICRDLIDMCDEYADEQGIEVMERAI